MIVANFKKSSSNRAQALHSYLPHDVFSRKCPKNGHMKHASRFF